MNSGFQPEKIQLFEFLLYEIDRKIFKSHVNFYIYQDKRLQLCYIEIIMAVLSKLFIFPNEYGNFLKKYLELIKIKIIFVSSKQTFY